MQENHRNGQEESDIVVTSEFYTPLQGRNQLFFISGGQFS